MPRAINKVIYGDNVLIDITDTTAIASDVASGKYFYTADGVKTVGTNEGGGGGVVPDDPAVRFIDYDGTVLYAYTAEDFAALAELPANPSHDGLTAQGWNWTLAQIQAQLQAMPDQTVTVGQMYITDDGKTRLYCRFETGCLSPYLGIAPNGTVSVDWGDGTEGTVTGTSLTSVKRIYHRYDLPGDYVITLTVLSGSFALYGTTTNAYLLNKNNTASETTHRAYLNCLRKIEIGNSVNIGMYAFKYCTSLENITIPNSIQAIGSYAFYCCYSLECVILPNHATNIGNYAFQQCYAISEVSMPASITAIAQYLFYYCYNLKMITIPAGVQTIGNYAFQNNLVLAKVTIPDGATSIGQYGFNGCYNLSSLVLPEGVADIRTYTFYRCYSLASVKLPANVQTIGSYAFYQCYSLPNITIPDSVTSIGSYAFYQCPCLSELHFRPTTPPTVSNSNAWTGLPTDCKIYVPAGSLEAYTSATNYPSSSTYTYVEE